MVELIGLTGLLFVLLSFVVNGEKNMRKVNLLGAFLSMVYGFSIGALSVWLLNLLLLLINASKLIKE